MWEQRGIQRSSSRREESKIAQGETLGKRSAEGFPPGRGGVKAQHRHKIPQSVVQVFDPPFQGGRFSLCLLPRAALCLPWAIFDGSLREQTDALLIGWPMSRSI
jgi:hypothetical protein